MTDRRPPEASADDGLPFSQAAANNRGPILAELRRLLAEARGVLEVGSGTGQHALYFAAALGHLRWQPSEHPEALIMLQARCRAGTLPNLAAPRALNIDVQPWEIGEPGREMAGELGIDTIYTANTLHIVAPASVEAFFAGSAATCAKQLIVYGPFNYNGAYTSESNERFDAWLRERDSRSGIRDFEWVQDLAAKGGFRLFEDLAMPANNRLLCWRRA
ncbi:MAG: DUF938 domain-containing protein [Halieaceae bacterium]|jgi:hypothetical protein|nr:DUF938 domain-containing protein [Halieaceae bacterium]